MNITYQYMSDSSMSWLRTRT